MSDHRILTRAELEAELDQAHACIRAQQEYITRLEQDNARQLQIRSNAA